MKSVARWMLPAILAVSWLLAVPGACWAQFTVTLDTSKLNSTYTYAIDYQFSLGGASTSNMAIVNGISFGTGGSAGSGSTLQTIGSVTGNLQSQPIVLSGTSGGFADFTEDFTPGNQLQFSVNVSNLPQTGGNSDTFVFDLLYLDPTYGWLNIATDNTNNNYAFLEIDTNAGGPLTVIASASIDSNFTLLAPDVVSDAVSNAPAPSSFCLVLSSLCCLLIRMPALVIRRLRTAVFRRSV
jgi:hypothetical protein